VDDDLPYYRPDLALVHHRGFSFHAENCAPGVLRLLEPVLERDGLVVELGCGSGLLTRYLVDAGHRVLATDASPAMLELARAHAPGASVAELVMPRDPIPDADAIVSVGHAINYLPDERSIDQALTATAQALQPGGVLAIDVCDVSYSEARADARKNFSHVEDDWAIITRFSVPAPNRFVREMTTFVRNDDGSWRRDDERHDNVLVDTSALPAQMAVHGVDAVVTSSFGDEQLPAGLHVLLGRRPADAASTSA
jgi:SAM-dependent methyltransferase